MSHVIPVPRHEQGDGQQVMELLYGRAAGAEHCSVMYVATPPGGGSAAGLHVHEVDQIFYVIEGVMEVQVGQETEIAEAGSIVVFPAGVPHRNRNVGVTPTRHLSIVAPLPPSGRPFASRVATEA